jgi:hypothetical protein
MHERSPRQKRTYSSKSSNASGKAPSGRQLASKDKVEPPGGINNPERALQIQQGDLLLQRIGPPVEVPSRKKRLVLQRGELSGHSHVLEGRVLRDKADPRIVVVGGDGAILTHQEHKPLLLPPGTYRIGRVREYCYDFETLQKTALPKRQRRSEERSKRSTRRTGRNSDSERLRDARGRFLPSRTEPDESGNLWRYVTD